MQYTLNQLEQIFKAIGDGHNQIRAFYSGDYSNYRNPDKLYPLLYIKPASAELTQQEKKTEFHIFVLDRVNELEEVRNEVYSDTLSILEDVKAYLQQSQVYNIIVDNYNAQLEPVSDIMDSDMVVGWRMTLKLRTNWDANICTIPGLIAPVISNEGQYVIPAAQYLTCDTVLSCTNIQNALNTKANTSGNTSFNSQLYLSGGTPLSLIINNIASQYSGGSSSGYIFSAGTNLTLFTASTNPNVVYRLSDGIKLEYGISGGSFFQTSVNPNQFLGESHFDNDVHISNPNLLSAYDAQLVNIYNTALTSTYGFIDSLTANTFYNYTATTDYLTVQNYFTAPTGYIDQLQSYQGGFQYDLSATTYYSGSTPLESIIYNIAANSSTISGQTFSAGTNLLLFTSSTTPNVTYQLNSTLTDILALYSLNIYNYADINNQGNIYNSGKITTTEAEMINLSATTAIYSGANFTNLETIIYNIATGSSVDYTAQLATKASLSGATFTGLIFAPTANTTYLKVNTLSANTTNPERAIIYDGVVNGYSNVLVGIASASTYAQLNIQNLSPASGASSDIIATANNGNESSNYVDLGINSSGFNSGNVGAANDGYVYGAVNDFYVGNTTRNKKVGIFVGASSATTVDFTSGNTTFNQPVSATTISASTFYSGSTLLQNYFPYDQSAMRVRGSTYDRYHTSSKFAFSFTTVALTANRLYATPLLIGENMTLDRIGISISTTSSGSTSVARLGIYNSNSNHLPSTLVADFGTITTSATTNLTTIAINQTLTPGLYFMALLSNATDTVRAIPTTGFDSIFGYGNNPTLNVAGQFYQAQTYGALPSSFTASTFSVAAVPAIFYRIN